MYLCKMRIRKANKVGFWNQKSVGFTCLKPLGTSWIPWSYFKLNIQWELLPSEMRFFAEFSSFLYVLLSQLLSVVCTNRYMRNIHAKARRAANMTSSSQGLKNWRDNATNDALVQCFCLFIAFHRRFVSSVLWITDESHALQTNLFVVRRIVNFLKAMNVCDRSIALRMFFFFFFSVCSWNEWDNSVWMVFEI